MSPPFVRLCATCVPPYIYAGVEGNFSNTTCPLTASRAADTGRLLLAVRRFADVGGCAMRDHGEDSAVMGRCYWRRAVSPLRAEDATVMLKAGNGRELNSTGAHSTDCRRVHFRKKAWTGCCAFIQRDVSRMLLAYVHVSRSTVLRAYVRHASAYSERESGRSTRSWESGVCREACMLLVLGG